VRVPGQVQGWCGCLGVSRCDNGPELLSEVFRAWSEANDIEIRYIQQGKPNQNVFIERFNRTYREEVLSSYLFDDLDEVRDITWEWLLSYNEERPHRSLGGLPPVVFRKMVEAGNSTFGMSC
jgi:putative transposase